MIKYAISVRQENKIVKCYIRRRESSQRRIFVTIT